MVYLIIACEKEKASEDDLHKIMEEKIVKDGNK